MARDTGTDPEIRLLLALLDEGFDRKAWHGPNLFGSLPGLSAEQARRRPAPGRNSIWQIAVHCAYWKSIVRRRVGDGAGERFPRGPANWPALPEPADDAAWKADLRLLQDEHHLLRAAVAALRPADLHRPAPGQKRPRIEHIHGIAMHDVYHAGQVRLVRRMIES
jgi:uncharacterized damage-inducible protein DinB